MKKMIVLCATAVGLSAALCLADQTTPPQAPVATQPAMSAATTMPVDISTTAAAGQLNPKVLSQNIQVLQMSRTRVLVLQDLLSRESAQLSVLEEQFCKLYNLDVDKFRKGLYKYDEKADKFVEVPAQETPKKKKKS